MIQETHQLLHIALTVGIGLASGAFGAGITIATFRNDIKSLKLSVKEIIQNQEILRGDGGNRPPLFIRRGECEQFRVDCNARICLVEHSKSIKSLENFARWNMQKEGLDPAQINDILRVD